MKNNYFVILLLAVCYPVFSQLNIGPLPPYLICETESDGYAVFDLNTYPGLAEGSSDYSVAYYAEYPSDTTLPAVYMNVVPFNQTIYVKVWETANPDNFDVMEMELWVRDMPPANPTVYRECALFPNSGLAVFDLTSKYAEILGPDANPDDYIISFSETFDGPVLSNITSYQNTNNPTDLTVTIVGYEGCTSFTTLTLEVVPLPDVPDEVPLFSCDGAVYDLTSAIQDEDYVISFYTTENDAEAAVNEIADPTQYVGIGSIWARVSYNQTEPDNPDCFRIVEIILTTSADNAVLGINTDGESIIIETQDTGAYYQYALDDSALQDSNVFSGLSYGYHTVTVVDECDNTYILTITLLPPPPVGDTLQIFTAGQTLTNLLVTGENLQWYADAELTNPLIPGTPLVDGVTYYVTQTIDGYESAALAVTVSSTAGLPEDGYKGFEYYPNPVSTVLTVSAPAAIKNFSVYNALGQLITYNDTVEKNNISINMQQYPPGIYFIKLYSFTSEKTLRIIKQ